MQLHNVPESVDMATRLKEALPLFSMYYVYNDKCDCVNHIV